ncbi:MAG: hypothetical protein D8M58_13135 [Calditrichaeota bacterium]|nr:MAG: hypothetical protein DWQ03_13920 [Calditrichota bacterium]MBL1206344.1 hypothetical protein [Calditrichota bacterium]NOG46170.1 hypothetical protein [Calditrichota bacterium]
MIDKTKKLDFSEKIKIAIDDMAAQKGYDISGYKILDVLKRPMSIVYKIKLTFHKSDSFIIYLKHNTTHSHQNKPQLSERDHETTLFWWEKFEKSDKYNVVEPLYIDSIEHILISKESKGYDISVYLTKTAQMFPSPRAQTVIMEMISLVGGWLKYFQSVTVDDEKGSEEISLEFINQYINQRMDRIIEKTKIGFDESMRNRVNTYISDLWQKVGDERNLRCYLHSDLSLSNVLYNDNKITVLDFTKRLSGSPYKDLTRFYHQLTILGLKPTFQTKFIRYLESEFLRGYGNPRIMDEPLFKIYLMTHIINHLGKSARYWEQSFLSGLYNRWVVYKTMKKLKTLV